MRPQIGDPTFLVYVECMCGQWGMIGEGGILPVCGSCGRRMAPGGGAHDDPSHGADYTESRQIRGLAFVGMLVGEIAAVGLVSRVKRALALADGWGDVAERHHFHRSVDRHYTIAEIAARLHESGFPTAPAWEGPPPWERAYFAPDAMVGDMAQRGRWLLPSTNDEEARRA